MAISKVDICNSALTELGDDFIIALDEDTRPAKLCNQVYDMQRRALLRQHNWGFAQTRVLPGQLSDAPAFEFSYAFQLPADCLRVTRFYDGSTGSYLYPDDVPYKIEGRTILADDAVIRVIYTKDEEDPNQFDPLFAEVLGLRLAAKIAFGLTQSRRVSQDLYEKSEFLLGQARHADSSEDYPEQFFGGSWANARK